jgi:hypothetical protein
MRDTIALENGPIIHKAAQSIFRDPALALALLAVTIRLLFWYYTKRTWEDALIALQHAENGARGWRPG